MKTKIAVFLSFLFVLFSPSAFSQSNYNYAQDELQKLVAPIALYPDPLLAQILPASTYPLEIVEAVRIIRGKKDFSKIEGQNWDPSVKAVAHYPDVLKMMSERLSWTQQLGQAVLAQQQDVMEAVQVMRGKAQTAGNLRTTPQQVIRQTEKIIEIVPSDPEIIYVPTYDTELVYVAPVVPVYRPLISFSIGFPLGDWLFGGFYWPTHSIFCADYHYWRGWWRDPGYARSYYNNTNITNINNTTINNTNIYNTNVNNTRVTQNNFGRPWFHNNDHGTPFHGGSYDPKGTNGGFHHGDWADGRKGDDRHFPNGSDRDHGGDRDKRWNPGNNDDHHGFTQNDGRKGPWDGKGPWRGRPDDSHQGDGHVPPSFHKPGDSNDGSKSTSQDHANGFDRGRGWDFGSRNRSDHPNNSDSGKLNDAARVGSNSPGFHKESPMNTEDAQKSNLEKFRQGMERARGDRSADNHYAGKTNENQGTQGGSRFPSSFQPANSSHTDEASNARWQGFRQGMNRSNNPSSTANHASSHPVFTQNSDRPVTHSENKPTFHPQEAPRVTQVSSTSNTANHSSAPSGFFNSHGGHPSVPSGHSFGGGSHSVARSWGRH